MTDADAPRSQQWQLDGTAPQIYDRCLVPGILAAWTPRLVGLAELVRNERVLDLACGTGAVARLAAERVGTGGYIAAVDVNAGMLEVARATAPVKGSALIEWFEASADMLPLPDETFHAVLCQQGLQFFAHRAVSVQEVFRVLAPGGRLALSVWREIERNAGHLAMAEALARHADAETAAIIRAPFTLFDAGELHELLAKAGFVDVTVTAAAEQARFPSCEAFVQALIAGSPLAEPMAKRGAEVRAAVIEDVSTALGSHVDRNGVAWATEAHLATARKI